MYYIKFTESKRELKYTTDSDLLNLLSYIYRPDKNQEDSVRANYSYIGNCSGCEPFFFPREYEHDFESVYQSMYFIHHVYPCNGKPLARHRIISFDCSELVLPQDLDSLGRQIVMFYSGYQHIAAYATHADKLYSHIHVVVDNINFANGTQLNISFEYNKLNAVVAQWQQQHDARLQFNEQYRSLREKVLYGNETTYGQIPLSAREQIQRNLRQKRI